MRLRKRAGAWPYFYSNQTQNKNIEPLVGNAVDITLCLAHYRHLSKTQFLSFLSFVAETGKEASFLKVSFSARPRHNPSG